MIILFFASVLLWGGKIESEAWMISLLFAFCEIIIELFLLADVLGVNP